MAYERRSAIMKDRDIMMLQDKIIEIRSEWFHI